MSIIVIKQNAMISAARDFCKPNICEAEKAIARLLKNSKINLDEYYETMKDRRVADRLLSENVFAYHPAAGPITFQLRKMEVYARQSREGASGHASS